MRYSKDARTPEQLVELLKLRGLVIHDEVAAVAFLSRVSFFRLKGYLLHFERKHVTSNGLADNSAHLVPPGTTFESVLALYELDRELRLLFFEAIEKIEICLRTALANTYAVEYNDPHWIWDANHFKQVPLANGSGGGVSTFHERLVKRIKRETGIETPAYAEPREREVYVDHYLKKYSEPRVPPTWVLCECLSFGVWAHVYEKLAATSGQKAVAKIFQVPYATLASWFHSLSIVRNICAHHARIWNRVFAIKPGVLPGADPHFVLHNKPYVQAFAAAYLVRRVSPATDWHIRMRQTLLKYPNAEKGELGAPFNWHKHPVWVEDPLPSIELKTILR